MNFLPYFSFFCFWGGGAVLFYFTLHYFTVLYFVLDYFICFIYLFTFNVSKVKVKEARNSFFGLGVYLWKSKFRIDRF